MIIQPGIPDDQIDFAVDLYWAAFGPKLGKVLSPEQRGKTFIRQVFDPTHAISAVDDNGRLMGVAGFKTHKGALVGGGFRNLWRVFGMGSLWRIALLALLERDVENERFLMDGIFVSEEDRGKGVGSALLEALYAEAKARGFKEIRLDVIDNNPRARALYERQGFAATGTHKLGPLALVFGFKSATSMVRPL